VFAVLDHPHLVAHAPLANHLARKPRRHLNVAPRAAGYVAEDNFFCDSAAHAHHQIVEQFIAALGVFVLDWKPHR
jgi:hypothetical protein